MRVRSFQSSVTRRHELAVRLALGAEHGKVLRLVVREGAVLVMLGLLIGAPGIYMTGRLIGGMLVDVLPTDPLTLVGVSLGLVLVTLATVDSSSRAGNFAALDAIPLLKRSVPLAGCRISTARC